MKKFITTLLSLALVIGMCPAMIANAETTLSGTGVEGDPYIIATAADLIAARDLINANANGEADACYKLTADIDLANVAWTPIAPSSSVPFTGEFDGAKHVISNINIELNEDNYSDYETRPSLAFFGYIYPDSGDTATVKDLGLDGVTVINNLDYINDNNTCSWQGRPNAIAGFVGSVNRSVAIENCFVKDATIAQNGGNGNYVPVGGFYAAGGGNSGPTFTNCYVYDATISGVGGSASYRDSVGGFGGSPGYTKIVHTNCYTAQTFTTAESAARTPFFAFTKQGNSTGTTATNCYTESDDIATVTGITSWNYNGDTTTAPIGTVGMTKEGLVEAMTAVGYVTVATINDGYPCLEWEKANTKWDGKAATAFAGGDGTEENPYKITTAAELKLAADTVNNRAQEASKYYFSLENDIDYEGNHWTPIGKSAASGSFGFRGGFDGNGHVVKNLSIEGTYAYYYCGFFGLINGATITDLGIDKLTIKVTNYAGASTSTTDGDEIIAYNIAGFAGSAREGATISGCYIKNSHVEFSTGFPTGAQTNSAVAGFINSIDVRDSNGDATVDTVSISDCYVLDTYIQSKTQASQCGFIGMFDSVGLNNAVSGHTLTNCYVAGATTKAGYTVYAFGASGSSTADGTGYTAATAGVTVSNCYSTLTSGKGSNANARNYHVNYDLGTVNTADNTTNVTPTSIATAFAGVEGWQDGTSINAGLPALAWETAPVVEVAAPYVVKAVSATKGTVTLEVNKDNTTGDEVYVATYDSTGRLVSVDIKDAAANITDVNVTTDGASKVKVFVWNGLAPVIDAVVKDLY